jgi:hypothetical protein
MLMTQFCYHCGPIIHLKFAEDALEGLFDCVGADVELLRDRAVAHALGDSGDDRLFALG